MRFGVQIFGAALLATAVVVAAPAFANDTSISQVPGGIEAVQGQTHVSITALTDEIVRVRIAHDGKFAEDASWAVASATRGKHVLTSPTADGFSTKSIRVRVDPATLAIIIEDKNGETIVRDGIHPFSFDGNAFTLRKAMPVAEKYYGLGDKTGSLDRRGGSFVNWNTDAYGFGTATDPIYKAIPFFIGSGGAGGSYGMFLDNSWRSFFDFGHREDGVLQVGSNDGPIDYYLIAGPSTADVVRRYTDLTGKAPLPPLWSFGYQQSRYSYMSDAEVREIAARLRSDKIPADVIWLDIDFQDRNRPFTTNAKTFPDLGKLAGDVGKNGIKLITITDLHIAAAPNEGYAPYDSGMAGKHFLRKADGSTYVAPVWPGPSVFPDFTDKAARDWWGGLYKDFVADGIAGFWNDMNEPAIFETPSKTMPLDNIHRIASDDFTTRDASHAEIHNVFGMENSRATFEGLKKLRPNERPYVMTRASYAGGQKYAVTWTGDNSSSWDHLKLSVQQLASLGLSGFAYSGADVGGFTGGATPELLTRWIQVAAFTPVFRVHAANNAPRTEPWLDGPDHLALRRKAIEERYRLMPYLYSVAEQNARTGDPIMRPIFYDYPALANAGCDQSMAFTLGRDLLIAGNPHPESKASYPVCLPKGGWYDYWSGKKAETVADQGGQENDVATETPSLERLPVFVRPGAIIPKQPLVQSTSETPDGPLSLDIYPGDDCRGELYFDDGHSIEGASLRQTIRCTVTAKGLTISFDQREGSYAPWWKEIAVTVHGWSGKKVSLGGKHIAAESDSNSLRFTLPDRPKKATVTLSAN